MFYRPRNCSKSFICAVVAMVMIFASATGCKKSKVDPFPPSDTVSGWQKTSDTRIFAAKDLWQYIDGDAEQYISAGVVTTSTSDYKYQGQLEAVVDGIAAVDHHIRDPHRVAVLHLQI